MDTLVQNQPLGKVNYLTGYARIVIALMASFFIILEGQALPFWVVLAKPDFYITLVFSFVIALVLLELVHQVSRLLDKKWGWRSHPFVRFFFQALLGFIMVVVIDLYLVKGFFWLFNFDFKRSRYEVSEFPLVKWMILVLNVYYWSCHFAPDLFRFRKKSKRLSLLENALDPSDRLPQNLEEPEKPSVIGKLGSRVKIITLDEILCFKRESSVGYIHLKDGNIWNSDHRIEDLLAVLDPEQFFLTSRGIIFSLDAIDGHRREKKHGILILKDGYRTDVSKTISRDRYPQFRENWLSHFKKNNAI